MKVFLSKGLLLDKENTNLKMGIDMRENLLIKRKKDMGFIFLLRINRDMKENGRMIRDLAKESIFLRMVDITMGNGLMEREKVREWKY